MFDKFLKYHLLKKKKTNKKQKKQKLNKIVLKNNINFII